MADIIKNNPDIEFVIGRRATSGTIWACRISSCEMSRTPLVYIDVIWGRDSDVGGYRVVGTCLYAAIVLCRLIRCSIQKSSLFLSLWMFFLSKEELIMVYLIC